MTPAEAAAARAPGELSKYASRKARDESWAEEYRCMIHEIAINPSEPSLTRLSAIEKGLDRIEGKPPQKQQVEIKRSIEEMTEAELASAIDLVRSAIEGRAGGAGTGSAEAPSRKPH